MSSSRDLDPQPRAMTTPPPKRSPPVSRLTPEELAAIDSSVEEISRAASNKNTARAYATAWRYFSSWHALRLRTVPAHPLDPATIVAFITDHFPIARTASGTTSRKASRKTSRETSATTTMPAAVRRGLVQLGVTTLDRPPTLTTLMHRLAALSSSHNAWVASAGPFDPIPPNPLRDPTVKQLMSNCRKAHARAQDDPSDPTSAADTGSAPIAPLTRDPLLQTLAQIDDSIRGLRDRALLLFAFSSGGRRRSEVSQATVRNLIAQPDGSYRYELRLSKTNQKAVPRADRLKPIVGEAAQALRAWLDAAGITSGKIFRRISKTGQVSREGITPETVRLIVRARTSALEGTRHAGNYSSRSLRSGFVSEAARRGVPMPQAMSMTGHKTTKAFLAYYRAEDVASSLAARLVDADPVPPPGQVKSSKRK